MPWGWGWQRAASWGRWHQLFPAGGAHLGATHKGVLCLAYARGMDRAGPDRPPGPRPSRTPGEGRVASLAPLGVPFGTMGTSRARAPRQRASDDLLAADKLTGWEAECLSDAIGEHFEAETSIKRCTDGTRHVYVASGRNVPDEEDLQLWSQGALAALALFEPEEGEGDDDAAGESEYEEEEEEKPARTTRRRGRLWASRRTSFATPADARQRPLPTPGNLATTRPVPPRDG